MAEDKIKDNLGRIEKLIVGGNKEVIDRVEKRLEEVKLELRSEMKTIESNLSGQIRAVHSGLKKEIEVTALAVQETVREEIAGVANKLNEHMRLPAHLGAG